MFSFENQITINRPPAEVFEFAADLINVPKWNYYVRSVTPTSKPAAIQGATYHQVRKDDDQDLRIVQLVKQESLVVETIPPSKPEFRREMVFEAVGGSTMIIDRWDLELGVPKLLEPLAANRASTGVKQNLGKLKELLETGEVTLQDGRKISL